MPKKVKPLIAKAPDPPPAKRINTYGLSLPQGSEQTSYNIVAFLSKLPFERTGMTRLQLYRSISDQFIPNFHEWHSWTERQCGALCDYRWISFAGCSNSAKTRNVAGFATAWWLCNPSESAVIFCSTTIAALRRRGWAEIQAAYQAMPYPKFGNFVDSKLTWQWQKGDSKHAIMGIAVEEGPTERIADNIKGHHPKRLMIVIDEATAVPQAIWDAASNLWSYPASQLGGDFIMVAMANPRQTRLDEFSRFSEPRKGWVNVSIDDEEWETVPQMDNKPGILLRFDALKCPNILAGRRVSAHLPTADAVDAAIKRAGSENDPRVWSNIRGFWAPQGLTTTVITESMLVAFRCYDHWTFAGDTVIVAGFDPAFSCGGDRAILKPARMGWTTEGMALDFMPHVQIPINAQSSNPIAYQLSEGLRAAAERIGLDPRNICMDATGEGGTLGDIIYRTWSREIMRVEFSSKASERPISHEDIRLGSDVYKNKTTELHFQTREFIQAGQVRGMDKELAAELVDRFYEPETASSKRQVESKLEHKARLRRSPDLADAAVLCMEAARRRGLQIKPIGLSANLIGTLAKEEEQIATLETDGLYAEGNEDLQLEEQLV